MIVTIRIIAIGLICMGLFFALRPQAMKSLMRFLGDGRRYYAVGVIRLVLAVLFLSAASEADVTWIMVVLGILFLVSGTLVFAMKASTVTGFISWYKSRPTWMLRLAALAIVIIGGLVLYAS